MTFREPEAPRRSAESESCKLTRSRQGARETRAGGAQKRLQAGERGCVQKIGRHDNEGVDVVMT